MGKLSQSYLKELAKNKYKSGGFSTEGYKRNSPDVNNPYNVIPSNQITMKDVDFPIMGIDDMGHQQMMYPGNDYTFPGNYVTEFPLKNMGNKRFGQMGISVPAPSFSDEFVSWINPFNWGVTDYSQYKTYNQAFDAARKAGEKEFMWKANRYNTRKDTDDLNIKNPPRPLALRSNPDPDEVDYFKAYPMTGKNYSDFIKNNYPEFFKVMNRGKGVGAINFKGYPTSPTRASYDHLFNTLRVGENLITHPIPDPKKYYSNYDPFMGSIIAEMAHLKNPEARSRAFVENFKYGDPGKYYVPGTIEYEAHRLHEPGLALTAYGNLSPSDIKRIQRHLGVKDDGIFGQKTYKALQEKYKDSPEIKMILPSYYRTSKDRDLNVKPMGKRPSLALAYLRQINKDVPLKNAYRFLDNSSSSNRSISNEYDYTDNALLNIVPGSGDYDVKELQQALVNRGYKLPKSTKKSPNGYSPGGLDGVWGEETKAALEDWQNKTRKKIANQQILKKTGQKGFYKPDFRSKSQIAADYGNTGESTAVTPKINPVSKRLIDEANYERLKNQQPSFNQGYKKTASDIERSDYYKKQQESKNVLKNALRNVDVVTDVMQVGNFIPHPIAQGIGQVGNWLGAATDVTQAGMDYGNQNYGSVGINLASAIVPTALGAASFRRSSKYLRPGQTLYPLSPQGLNPNLGINVPRTTYIEPFNMVKGMTKTNLMANRALLGTLGVETAYDAGAFDNNTRLGLPINMQKPNYAMGGTMGIPGVNGQVVSSGPTPLTSVRKTRGPINKTKKGDVKTMSSKQVKQTLKYSKQQPNKL